MGSHKRALVGSAYKRKSKRNRFENCGEPHEGDPGKFLVSKEGVFTDKNKKDIFVEINLQKTLTVYLYFYLIFFILLLYDNLCITR